MLVYINNVHMTVFGSFISNARICRLYPLLSITKDFKIDISYFSAGYVVVGWEFYWVNKPLCEHLPC